MEGDGENVPLANGNGVPIHLRQYLNVFADLLYPRSPNEDGIERSALEQQLSLEGRELPTERIAPHLDVEDTEMVPVQHDHSCTRAQDGLAARDEVDERLTKPLTLHAEADRRGLAARNNEAVEPVEVRGRAHLANVRAQLCQCLRVSLEPALEGEDTDNSIAPVRAEPAPSRTTHQPRFWSSPPFS